MNHQRSFGNSFNYRRQSRFGGRGFRGGRWIEAENPIPNTPENISSTEVNKPSGWEYVGPCRCGRGPHAFYKNPKGGLIHASQVPTEEQ